MTPLSNSAPPARWSARRQRIASMLAAAPTATMLLLTACSPSSPGGPSPEQCDRLLGHAVETESPRLILVLDRSASRWDSPLEQSSVDAIRTTSETKGAASVLLVEGAGAPPRWLVEDASLNDPSTGRDTAAHRTAVSRAAACLEARVVDRAPAHAGTDLGEAIRAAVERGRTLGVPVSIVIETDGLSNAGPLDLTDRVLEQSVEDTVDDLEERGWVLAAPTEMAMTFSGIARTAEGAIAPPAAEWLRTFYEEVCTRIGADPCAVSSADQGVPDGVHQASPEHEDPSVNLPGITLSREPESSSFEVAGSLLFGGNSAELRTGAETLLAPIAACLSGGGAVRVVGHAARDGASADVDQRLSEQRASAVAELLRSLAPESTITAQGMGSTQPLPPDGTADPRPQDRRVEVFVDRECT